MSLGYYFNRLIRLSLVLIFIAPALMAQGSGNLKGKVTDRATKEELPGANIIVRGTSNGAAADLDGNFIIRNISSGKQTVVVSYIGYIADTVEVDIPSGRTLEQDFSLSTTVVEGEEVVVTAQALGQLEAINQQLSSDKISNIVSEQRIQQLPDFNAASALSRLPGISTTQSSGEDNKVVIRGLSPKYNSIEIEGVQLSSTGSTQIGLSSNPELAAQNVNNDRSVDLTMISPYMIRMIAVYKSLTPDMNANSIGGTVNMELREAPTDLHWDLLWQQGFVSQSNTYSNYRGVASGSSRFFDDKFGVYALLNLEAYDRDADNMDAAYDIKGGDVTTDPLTGFRPTEVNNVTFNRHLERRERYGANLILDYALAGGSVKFVNLFARINSNFTEHRQTIDYDQGRMNWQLRMGENVTDQQMHSLDLDYDFGFLTSSLSASFTGSRNNLDNSPQLTFNQVDALQAGVPRDNKKPEDLTYLLTEFKGVPNVVLRSGNMLSSKYKEEKFTYKADFEVPFSIIDNDLSGFIKFGGQLYNQKNSTDQETPYLSFAGGQNVNTEESIQASLIRGIRDNFGYTPNSQGDLTGEWFVNSDNDLFNAFLEDTYGDIYYISNPDQISDMMEYIINNPEFDASNSEFSTGAQGGWYNGPFQKLTNDYEYKEDYYATYAMSRINFLNFMVIGGVRYEKVESDYFAYNARDLRNAQKQVMYDTTSIQGNEFMLPMAQVKYQIFDWMDIRYAYTHTLSRPDYSQLSPKFTITQGNQIYTGNPNLKPAKAINHDLSFSFYTNELGLLTVGGFYKTIENFVYNASYQLDAAQRAGIDALYRYTIVRDGALVVTPQNNAMVFRPLNNPNDATVKGLEFDLQHNFWYAPAPFNNVVLGFNYARIWSETTYPFYDVNVVVIGRDRIAMLVDSSAPGRLIDQPNHILNTYVGYDYEGFSARLSFLFQDNSATGNGGRDPENDSYTTDYFRIDFSARQALPFFNSEVFLDVKNLNDARTSGIQRGTQGFRNIQAYGLSANLGVRLRY